MHYKRSILCLMGVLTFSLSVFAQQGSIKDLKPIFDRLKTMKSYSFDNHTDAVFPNGQRDAIVTKVFMDKTRQCLFYTNKGETLLLNRKWVYKANHVQKTAQVFDIAAYNKQNKKAMPALQTLFQYDMVSGFLDSLVMKHGKLMSTKKEGTLTTYQIGFAAGTSIKQMTIVYNDAVGLPESIYIRTIIGEGDKKMQSEILCNNYKAVVPDAVFDEHAFFAVTKGKVSLTQYKNYKVYALL